MKGDKSVGGTDGLVVPSMPEEDHMISEETPEVCGSNPAPVQPLERGFSGYC
jgi:hypothetical protein